MEPPYHPVKFSLEVRTPLYRKKTRLPLYSEFKKLQGKFGKGSFSSFLSLKYLQHSHRSYDDSCSLTDPTPSGGNSDRIVDPPLSRDGLSRLRDPLHPVPVKDPST